MAVRPTASGSKGADARTDYKRLFAERKTPMPAGIGVLTDSDDTRSSAEGDDGNFRVCTK
jgi:hypothetical protein